jgi:hypothetical protein
MGGRERALACRNNSGGIGPARSMTQFLGDDIVAAVPHRDLLFLFGTASEPSMRAAVETEFHSAPKPLTAALSP